MNKKFDSFDVAFFSALSAFTMLMVCAMMGASDNSAEVVLSYQKLRDNKVPITMNKSGSFFLWNEAAKKSYRLQSSEVKELASEMK